jgi:hypothetical protein
MRKPVPFFFTTGEYDLMQIIETANADNIAKYALANGSLALSTAAPPSLGRRKGPRRSSPNCLKRRRPARCHEGSRGAARLLCDIHRNPPHLVFNGQLSGASLKDAP